MYLYFDKGGTLREQITVSPVRVGDINVNKIYVYWEDNNPTGGYCIYRKPDGTNTQSLDYDEFIETTIPYDQNRDLKFFKYNTPYRFCVFNMPDTESENNIFIPSGTGINSVLFSCWLLYNTNQVKGMSLVTFAVEPTTLSVANDQNINVAQWNMLISLITGTAQFESINVKDIEFQSSEEPSASGLSVKDNIIYWRGNALISANQLVDLVVDLIHAQTIAGDKTFTGKTTFEDEVEINIEDDSDPQILKLSYKDNDTDKTATYNINSATPNDETYDIVLPDDDGTLALTKNTVNRTGDQTIDGEKTFLDKVNIQNYDLSLDQSKIVFIDKFTNVPIFEIRVNDDISQVGETLEATVNIYADSLTQDGQTYNIKIPNKSGTLALKSEIPDDYVALSGDQTINGDKQFNGQTVFKDQIVINVEDESDPQLIEISYKDNDTNKVTDYNILSATPDDSTYDITMPSDSGTLALTKDIENALTPKTDLTATSSNGDFVFTIDGSDYNGLYIFKYFNNVVELPLYNLVDNTTYNFTGIVQEASSGVDPIISILAITKNGNSLTITTWDSGYTFDDGISGTLKRIKLY